jgi:acetyltransferase-like isoleucine patch superfamily enzyme
VKDVRLHPSADVSPAAAIGPGSSIWHHAQVRERAIIGPGCVIGKGVYIGAGVRLGENCKVQNYACVYEGSVLEDGVFVGPGVVLTNDRYPRAINPDGTLKAASDWELAGSLIRYGAALGAGSVILPGLTVGRWALVAAGSVVTRDVPDFALVAGSPARRVGWACLCAQRLDPSLACPACGRQFRLAGDAPAILEPVHPTESP